MANCDNCSAPLPPNSIICQYCGSRNDTDLKGIHRFTVTVPDTERTCPRCSISLQTIDLKIEGTFLIERCERCLGLFFDVGELEALIKASVTHVYQVDRHKITDLNETLRNNDYPPNYIKCPVCGTLMSRVNFGARSGVIIDKCPDHGIWLDGGELRHLLEWVKAGGELLSKQREEERKKDEARQNERKNRRTPYVSTPPPADFDLFGHDVKTQAPDIFTVLYRVVRWLAR